jgi:heptosyltransferase-2
MNHSSAPIATADVALDESPVLIVPYMWIGDFVRCHSVVKLLRAQRPARPVDFLTSTLCAPLLDYMPGVRKGIVCDLPRRRLALARHFALAQTLRAEGYGSALVMLRTWKSALAPFLAKIPQRVGFAGEGRFFLLNDLRWGERRLERMIDRCGALALPAGVPLPADWPLPGLVVPPAEAADWRSRNALAKDERPVVAFAPGAVGTGKAWPPSHYADLAGRLARAGINVWVLGGPNEVALAGAIAEAGGAAVRNLTGGDLRNAILALASATAAVTNDSGLMHVAAALGTPTIGIFGPTSPRHWAPLNPLAAILEPPEGGPCPTCAAADCRNVRHRRTRDVSVERVLEAVTRTLSTIGQVPATADRRMG